MFLFRKVLIGAVVLGRILAGAAFLIGRLAHFDPALDLYNNFLPFLGLSCLALLALALALRSRALIGASVALTSAGPWLGSDHRPVVAHIALIE